MLLVVGRRTLELLFAGLAVWIFVTKQSSLSINRHKRAYRACGLGQASISDRLTPIQHS